jgi:hypothetical protein
MEPKPGWRRRARKPLAIIVLVLVVLFGTDMASGFVYRTSTAGSVVVTAPASGPARQAIVVFPGYVMSGGALSAAFSPHLGATDAMVVVDYAERGVDMDDLYSKIVKELHRISPRALRVYGASMGGMCAREFLTRYQADGLPFGKAVLILDTAPASADMVKRPGWMFWLASWYRGGFLSSVVWSGLSRLGGSGPEPEPDADRDLIRQARRYTADIGMPAITSQAEFIKNSSPVRPGELTPSTSRVVYLHGRDADRDPLVRVTESILTWRVASPGLTAKLLETRQGDWHIPLIERPRETVEAMLSA